MMKLKRNRLLIAVILAGVWLILPLTRLAALNDDKTGSGIFLKKYPGNYTCFQIESAAGVRIITDPYQMNERVPADIVTESHQHLDHSDAVNIMQPYQLITACGDFNIKGIKIIGIPGHHNLRDQGITNIIYIFDIDGIKIAQFASQGEMLSPEMLKKIGNVDILIIQLGTFEDGKLIPYNAGIIAQTLGAKIVIPAHDTALPKVREELAGILGNKEVMYVPSGQLKITKADFEGIKVPRVMVLDN